MFTIIRTTVTFRKKFHKETTVILIMLNEFQLLPTKIINPLNVGFITR